MQLSTLASLIPATKLPIVERALLTAFNTTDPTHIELLAGGLSASAVYKLTLNGQQYALKLDSPATPLADNNTTNPFECMEIAANAGIAPPLYYIDKENALSITGFIEKKPLRTAFASPDQLLTELATTLRSIHGMPLFSKKGSLSDTVEGLIREIKESPLFTKYFFEDFFEYYSLIQQHYPWQDTDKVSSHNDPNPNNFVYDGEKIWVIDWDAAFQNDRYVDLAITANFFAHTEVQEKILLEAYFSNTLTPYKSARLFIMRQICRLIYAILMFKLAYASNTVCLTEAEDPEWQTASLKAVGDQLGTGKLSLSSWKGQLWYGKALLNEALNSMRSPRFVSSIEQLKLFPLPPDQQNN
jgi:hypothetical protein